MDCLNGCISAIKSGNNNGKALELKNVATDCFGECFSAITGDNHNGVSRRSIELKSQMTDLEKQIDEVNKILPEIRQKREEGQSQAMEGKQAIVESLHDQLRKQLQDDLAAARAASDKVQEQQKQLQKAINTTEKPAPQVQIPFQSARSVFRSKTPLECKNLKIKVTQLMEELNAAQSEINSEKKLLQQASNEIIRQDVITASQDLKIRSNNRKALDQMLKTFAEADSGESQQIASDLKTDFNNSSSERQREMKAQIAAFYAELATEEKKILDAATRVQEMSSKKPDMFSYKPCDYGSAFKTQ